MSVKIFIIIVVVFSILIPLSIEIVSRMNLCKLHKKFNELELNSLWILKTESTNPFNTSKVRVIAKQMGTDGETPWVLYEFTYGTRSTLKFEDFINLYTQI